MARVLKVRTTDMVAASRVKEGSLRYGPLELGAHAGVLEFTLMSYPTALPFVPKKEDYISYSKTDGTTLVFGGKLRWIERHVINAAPSPLLEYRCSAVDWNAIAGEIVLNTSVDLAADQPDITHVKTLLDACYGQIGSGITHKLFSRRSAMPAVSFGGGTVTLAQALDELARIAYGATWWIGPDKVLHWEDFTLAPYGYSDAADGTYFKAYKKISETFDATSPSHRVYVIGKDGQTYRATDWTAVQEANERVADEPSAPTETRIYQKPDLADLSLNGQAKLQQAGFADLDGSAPRRVVTIETETGEDILPGQLVDITCATLGTGSESLPYVEPVSELYLPSASEKLDQSMGRFLVQRVDPRPREGMEPEFVIQAGAYLPDLTAALGRV